MSETRPSFNRSRQPKSWARRIGTFVMVGLLAAGTFASLDAEAKRMGGGRSIGRQSQSLQQRQATPPAQQQPMQQAAPAQPPRAQPAPAAQPNRSRWLGPIAGLAAGLGIAALLSHFGLGGAFASMMANVIVIALLAMVGIWLFRKLAGRRAAQQPAYAGGQPSSLNRGGYDAADARSGASNGAFGGAFGSASAGASTSASTSTGSAYAGEAQRVFGGGVAAVAAPSVPAGFDTETFLRNAKVYFVRLQAAWDEGNLADIREFTTPEMFAEVKIDLDGRGAAANQTDVVRLDAELLSVEDRGSEHVASVRFHGLIREAAGAPAEPFNEVWNLSKSGSAGWLLAGIQQVTGH
ncbi:Tim44 domain-containing protein [Burkholderia singularis]|uniref:Putative membrane protein n=1 Tax=Burkholderia singularis TaxID=1503053 RepID=A0A238GZD3_9BURK|nr:TIM44-like domain-containing protein [Burkholderia singularis]SMF98322.1 putative membrane protein [Burkholderia singularis]